MDSLLASSPSLPTPLSRLRICNDRPAAVISPHSHACICNTYTAGERWLCRRGMLSRSESEREREKKSTYIRRCRRLRAGFVLRPGPTSAAISLSLSVSLCRPTPHGCGTIFQPRLWSPPWTLLPAGSAYSYIIFAREIPGLASVHTCAHTPCARKESARCKLRAATAAQRTAVLQSWTFIKTANKMRERERERERPVRVGRCDIRPTMRLNQFQSGSLCAGWDFSEHPVACVICI